MSKSAKDVIRAQVCESGHKCRCEFDERNPSVSMMLSGNCCVHGEKDCEGSALIDYQELYKSECGALHSILTQPQCLKLVGTLNITWNLVWDSTCDAAEIFASLLEFAGIKDDVGNPYV